MSYGRLHCVDISDIKVGQTILVQEYKDPTKPSQVYTVTHIAEVPEHDWVKRDEEWFIAHPDARRSVYALGVSGRKRHMAIRGRTWFTLIDGDHHPVCKTCGEYWPCRHMRAGQAVALFQQQLARMCAHCNDEVKPGQFLVSFHDSETGERVVFHGRKKNGCGAAAEQWARTHGQQYRVVGS